jgi:hypothetical protein
MKMIEINGRPIGDGQTVVIDSVVQTIEVQIRSIHGVSQDVLKRLIEQQYEVVAIEQTDAVTYVSAGCPDFIGE